MEHRGDQFDRRIKQEGVDHNELEVTEPEKVTRAIDELPQENGQSEIKNKSIVSNFIRNYIYEEPEVKVYQEIEQDEINLKSLVSGFIGTYILFLVLFEACVLFIGSSIGANGAVLSVLLLIGLILALVVAFYVGQKSIPKEVKYEELYGQFIASAIFFAIVIPLIPFTIYFGFCALLFL